MQITGTGRISREHPVHRAHRDYAMILLSRQNKLSNIHESRLILREKLFSSFEREMGGLRLYGWLYTYMADVRRVGGGGAVVSDKQQFASSPSVGGKPRHAQHDLGRIQGCWDFGQPSACTTKTNKRTHYSQKTQRKYRWYKRSKRQSTSWETKSVNGKKHNTEPIHTTIDQSKSNQRQDI